MNKKEKTAARAAIRKSNLARFVEREYAGNRSKLARVYAEHMKIDPSPSFFSDLLREKAKKSFAEGLASEIEAAVGLVDGQLSLVDSPLEMREPKPKSFSAEISAELDGLDGDERALVALAIQDIKNKRRKRRRA